MGSWNLFLHFITYFLQIPDVATLCSPPPVPEQNGSETDALNGDDRALESSSEGKSGGGSTTEDLLLEIGGGEENGSGRWEALEGFDPAPSPTTNGAVHVPTSKGVFCV